MLFQFKIEDMSLKERKYLPEFCNSLIRSMKSDIYKNLIYQQFISRKDYILKQVNWIEKPVNINMRYLVDLIIDRIDYKILKNDLCIIYVRGKLPNSYTDLDKIARFLDRGNEDYPPTSFLSITCNKYKRRIHKLWISFLKNKTRKFKRRKK